jgi:hypothetical protein
MKWGEEADIEMASQFHVLRIVMGFINIHKNQGWSRSHSPIRKRSYIRNIKFILKNRMK